MINRVQEHRKAADLTQRQLADEVGVTDQTISNIERGESRPDVGTALAIARALATDVETLFGPEASSEVIDDIESSAASAGTTEPSRGRVASSPDDRATGIGPVGNRTDDRAEDPV